ncbi:protein hupE [Terrihabitans soli]|uniref:Protein hupE n=1 Tax=Terrihabitans soli TaxID=708113 RepID=A0A6S6QUI3_9HYPH|nr:HupE/UreJ family protein [Terrihabitans soli]BCJ90620.1 protein hupE [Terrihabitans soli]
MKIRSLHAAIAMAALFPSMAFAHTGAGHASGVFHGFAHPVSGLDHILAMVLVGLLAFQLGGRALYAVPASFVLLMAAGGALGIAGIHMPFVETGIALSIIVFGAAVAFGVKAPVAAVSALVGLFAMFHGHAHGAEMPADASGLFYGLGFMLATAILHVSGIAGSFVLATISAQQSDVLVRVAGAAGALSGMAILAGIL